jgi:hypothetical protein
MSTGTNQICWGDGSVAVATPLVGGVIYGCTNCSTAALGQNAGKALNSATTNTVAIGQNALCSNTTGTQNTAVGACALVVATTAGQNTAIGQGALSGVINGNSNTAIGVNAGSNLIGGCNNVIIGQGAQVPAANGSDQMVIGTTGYNWITGVVNGDIKPGRGILDSTNSAGTAGQVLTSTGNALQWQTGAIGGWTDSGLIFLGGTTVNPAGYSYTLSNARWRRLGPKEYEVVYSFNKVGGQTFSNYGDMLLMLPTGLPNFDTTLPWQNVYNGSVGAASAEFVSYMLPNSNGNIGDGSNIGINLQAVVWNGNQFRLIANSNLQPVGFNYFYIGAAMNFRFRLQFTAA